MADEAPPKYYEVKLKRPVKFGGEWLVPKDRHYYTEAAIKEMGDAVESYSEVK